MRVSRKLWLLSAKLTLAAASAVCTLLVLEMGARVALFGADALSYRKLKSVRPLGVSGLIQPSDHPDVLYELKPSLDTWFKLVPFRTNSRGLRDVEMSLVKPPGRIRVAVVGDSFTMGAAVKVEETYHGVLEGALARETGTPFEFVNLGVGGYTLRQYVGTVRHRVAAWEPDLVIVGFTDNDDIIPRPGIFERPYEVKPPENPFFGSFLLEWIRVVRRERWIEQNRGAQVAERGFRAGSDSERSDYVRNHLRDLREWSEQHGVPVLVAFIALDGSKRDFVRRLVEEQGLSFVDTSVAFRGRDPADFRPYRLDGHPNAEGHAMIGEVLLQHLRAEGTVDALLRQ